MIKQQIARAALSLRGWKLKVSVEVPDKCIICIAPHTSNWDFIVGQAAAWRLRLKSKYLMKKEWFFFPMNILLKGLGGIPIHRGKKNSTVETLADEFALHKQLRIAISPEGTRSPNADWKKGFYYIALKAQVPILLAYLDVPRKEVGLGKLFMPSGDIEVDFAVIREFYKDKVGFKPDNFLLPALSH